MPDLLTPKQVARALDVSESSIKRWCDKGVISAQHTAGGHRRIAMSGLIQFLRQGDHELVHPEALGLPPTSGQTAHVVERAHDQMTESLISGDELRCRQIAIDLYLAQHSLAVLCDQVFAPAFRAIGELWESGSAEIYQERRSCEILLRLLHELRSILPPPPTGGPLAIGGTPAGDPYNLGTTMAELVLRDALWNATSLGDNLPFETLASAITQHQPQLFWLSCSHIENEAEFLAGYGWLYDQFGKHVAFVVGGNALSEGIRQQMKYSTYCDSMQHLEGFSQTLRGAIEK